MVENSEDDSASGSKEIAKVTKIQIKAPPFWKTNPALWFCQLEAQFEMNRITSDKAKYFTVVAAIESTILNQVSDLVLDPPDTNRYTTLKTRLLDVFVDSEQSRLKKLLGEIELADQKPSFLLREMRNLAGTSISADLLKTLWLQRLPSNIQAILSISSETIDRLVVMADKIFETTDGHEIHKLDSHSRDNNLESQISALTRQVADLNARFSRRDYDMEDRNSGNRRNISNSRTRPRSRTPYNQTNKTQISSGSGDKLCWYHSKWGDKASKCVGDCSYKAKGPRSGN